MAISDLLKNNSISGSQRAALTAAGSDMPDWLTQDNSADLRTFQSQIPGLFDMSATRNAYNGAMDSQYSQGMAGANAAGTAYTNRAMQVGASGMGGGFATGQAMLGVNNQRAQMMKELAALQNQSNQAQAGAMGTAAGDLSRLAAQRTSQIADWTQSQKANQLELSKLQQQQGQFSATLNENARQFTLSQAQQDKQNTAGMAMNKEQFAASQARGKDEFGRSLAQDDNHFNRSAAMSASTLANNQAEFAYLHGQNGMPLNYSNGSYSRAPVNTQPHDWSYNHY